MTPTAVSHGFADTPSAAPAPVTVRRLDFNDITAALRLGYQDLRRSRTDALTIAVLYPVATVFLATAVVFQSVLPLIFPVCTGFALIGPMATLWYVARSRQRERGDEMAISVFTPDRLLAAQRLCAVAITLFVAWNVTAGIIFGLTLGSSNADLHDPFWYRLVHTEAGWILIGVGCLTGAAYALLALVVFFVSFPAVIDRQVSARQAIGISMRVMLRNPLVVLTWGAVVVAFLVIGAIPVLLGLMVTLPVLGHASWHLYRRAVD